MILGSTIKTTSFYRLRGRWKKPKSNTPLGAIGGSPTHNPVRAHDFKSWMYSSSITMAYRGSVYTNGFLKVWLGIPASNRNWGSQSPFCYHYNNPQYTSRFIHPTYCNRYGLWGFRRQSWISTSAYTANAREASSSCAISLISDVTLPTRLGLRPIALRYLFLPQQHYIFCPSCYPTFSRTRTRAISFSFRIVGQSF